MREYKFRGLTESGKWVFGMLIFSFEGVHIVESEYFKPSNDAHPELTEVIPETVGQFTGLKDRNGVEIYEGDKLQDADSPRYIHIVKYKNGSFGWEGSSSDCVEDFASMQRMADWIKTYLSIIGNIHEDAE